jgi:hypothetical protein
MYKTNPHTEEELKENIQRNISDVTLKELHVNLNLFKQYEYACV